MNKQVLNLIEINYNRAIKNHPEFCDSILHGASIVAEESGELSQACNDMYQLQKNRESSKKRYKQAQKILSEAAHTAVTAIRFMETYMGVTNE